MKGFIETSDMLWAILNKDTGISTGGVLSHMSLTYLPAYNKMPVVTDAAMIINPGLN